MPDDIPTIQLDSVPAGAELQKRTLERVALKTLSAELTRTLDLGEAIDVVNRYLWELLDYTASMYVVYNYSESQFEARAYLKNSVNEGYLKQMHSQLAEFFKVNSKRSIVGAVSSVSKNLKPLMFGVPVDEKGLPATKSNFIIPLKVGGKIVGALNITSVKDGIFNKEDMEFVEMMTEIASVSIARIQTFVQSQHSSMEALVQSIHTGVVMFDNDMNVNLANETAISYTGLPKEGYNLKELTRLFSGVNLMDLVLQALSQDKVVEVARTPISRFWYEVAVVPVKNYRNAIIGGAIVFHDITHLVEVDKAKTEFVSLASHQLRTPLSAIRWYTEMLLSPDLGGLNEDQKKYMDIIEASNLRMIELVNSLLNVSRIELGTFAVEPKEINLVEIANSVLQELKHKVSAKKQTVKTEFVDVPEIYNGDSGLTRIIFQNLLSNAVKYTPEGGSITLTLMKQPENILLKVTDTGYGIPQDQRHLIFSKLFRADNVKTKETDGTGLGLYIIKSITETVGGGIRFESEENKGTTFFVTLPLDGMKAKKGSKPLEMTAA
jgi:signal transduction histidine kinase